MPVRKASFGLCVALFSSVLYLVLHYVTNSISNVVKQPYMDEIFHVPQAQRFCQNNFTYYDPKLTTPPGLYLVTYARIWLRDRILMLRTELVCDTIDLRRTNHLIAIINFIILVLIQLTHGTSILCNRWDKEKCRGFRKRITFTINHSTSLDLAKILLTAIAITLLPPLFFFNSLYYTDSGSLLFTLIAYLFSINDHHSIAALWGIVAVLFRQTNIVWLFYMACLLILRQAPRKSSLRQLITDWQFIKTIVRDTLPYALLGSGFIAFVVINKGIVLGDQEAHKPMVHSAQILYFLGFCSIFGSSWIFQVRIIKRFLYFTIRSPLTAIIASALIIYLIAFGRYAHPYLLADNRHLTFYIWRRILDRHNSYVPYLLTPVYLLASLSVWHHSRNRGCKQMLLYLFCTILAIVPNGLLEPRYFIIPFVFLRLSVESSSLFELIVEIGQQLAINMSMHYLFLHKTFHWTDSPEVQRIMW